MGSLVHSTGYGSDQQFGGIHEDPAALTTLPSYFSTIPPERVGLSGEYDHCGLAKRVEQAFRQYLPEESLQRLRISQRGGVVVLSGDVATQEILTQLIDVARSLSGTFFVETTGVRLLCSQSSVQSWFQPFRKAIAPDSQGSET
jgi:osmotically-inducible protein OsmY